MRRLRRMEFWKIIHGEWSGKLVMKLKRIIWRDEGPGGFGEQKSGSGGL